MHLESMFYWKYVSLNTSIILLVLWDDHGTGGIGKWKVMMGNSSFRTPILCSLLCVCGKHWEMHMYQIDPLVIWFQGREQRRDPAGGEDGCIMLREEAVKPQRRKRWGDSPSSWPGLGTVSLFSSRLCLFSHFPRLTYSHACSFHWNYPRQSVKWKRSYFLNSSEVCLVHEMLLGGNLENSYWKYSPLYTFHRNYTLAFLESRYISKEIRRQHTKGT